MSLHLKALSFDAHDPMRLAHFWATALGWDVQDEIAGTVELAPTDGTRFGIIFVQAPPSQKLEKNRIHLDLTTSSVEDQHETVEQLIALGGYRVDVGQGLDATHVVLADPEGNEFCVIEPGNGFLATCDRLGSITCDGSRAVGVFWSEALGWPLTWDQDEETAIRAPDGIGPFTTWGPPVKPKVMKNRNHLELTVSLEDDMQAEVDRLVSLGATLAEPDDFHRTTVNLHDPDGNEFTVVPHR